MSPMASVGAWIEVAKTGDTVIIHSSPGIGAGGHGSRS
jgi:hypothetical protein